MMTKTNLIIDFDKCTGCSACYSICSKNAIDMKKNDEGFLYPIIDYEKCVACGMCSRICPIHNHILHKDDSDFYAFKNSEDIRKESTSGGFFSLISDLVLEQKGNIYGAIFDEDFKVVHDCATTKDKRNEMRHSKYVQSEMGNVFQEVKDDLLKGKEVLFTGTPCQIAGLNNYLLASGVHTENLLTCDFICHGTPSPLMWEKYLDFVKSKYEDEIVHINFRNKELGWHRPRLKIEMRMHEQVLDEKQDFFYQIYYSNCIMRLACHSCEYASVSRVADLTMGDCWGIEKSCPKMDDNKGLSLVIANSHKGKKIIKKNRERAAFDCISLDMINQPHLANPSRISRRRNHFWIDYKKHNFIYILKKYGNYSLVSKSINWAKGIAVKLLRR